MSWALSQRDLKDSSARHVLLCLANYAGTDGRGAFPSAHTLSADTGLSERTVRYKLDDLEKKYDEQFRVVFEAIRQLMAPPEPPPKRRIACPPLLLKYGRRGFGVEEPKPKYRIAVRRRHA